jgi:hypothetical protein
VVTGEAGQHAGFIGDQQVDGVDELQFGVFLARIVAALEQGEIQQLVVGDAQPLHDGRAQVFFGVVQGQLEFSDS